ncbi:helix-turn-helix transcriptional regulator [Peribacillus glennii]|uniref:Helix-turn-helix domain-containing protein n=1 Tax=Peribacillus glennii TaxID=2303991 RepID=A0A372L954_9BACI|nr:helix-turn-helix domain-containing protein [Peribacillus glennii]RFU62058.1 helix-turn-helix domain-containing protein [Peribacillus glennii]
MIKEEVIEIISEKIKLIRVEMGYTQDKLAEAIGVSKKTLVQIEKGRVAAGWTVTIAVCALFRESSVIQSAFGGDPLDVVETIARERMDYRKEKTLGGKVWWKELSRRSGYILQQNIVSQHYRILDDENFRIYSSLAKEEAEARFAELVKDSPRQSS